MASEAITGRDVVGAEPTSEAARDELAPVADGAPYPRVEPGVYEAECVKASIFRDRQFQRWVCVLQFSLLPDGERVFCFLNLGNGGKPHAGRRSEYFRVWVLAAGEQPRRRQVLSHRLFQGKIFRVRIADVEKRFDGRPHAGAAIYSVVKEVLKRTWP